MKWLNTRDKQVEGGDEHDFRARETVPDETDLGELPSVNKKRSRSPAVTFAGYAAILMIATALIVAVNMDRKPTKPKTDKQAAEVANRLPTLAMPDAPPVINPSHPAVPALNPGQQPRPIPLRGAQDGHVSPHDSRGSAPDKPVMTWEQRKRAGNMVISARGFAGAVEPDGARGANHGGIDTAGVYTPAAESGMSRPGTPGPHKGDDQKAQDKTEDELALRLVPTVTKGVSASLLPDRRMLITKGTSLGCVLQTALNTTVPGITTCQLTRDIYSDNGQVLLMERGTKLVGEYKGGVKQGQARIFVLWTRAETPHGVIVNLASPGTDSLGRAGVEGWVDRHFAERFGAAILWSLVQDWVDYEQSKQQETGSTVVYGNTQSASESMVGKMLDSSINIPPTLIKNHGDVISVMVARDLDFSTVYKLSMRGKNG